MPNSIKYTTSTETKALRKGNFYIAVGDDPKAPTSQNGYWVGYDVPPGGYVTYLNKESNGPSIYVYNNDSDLISTTNNIDSPNINYITNNPEPSLNTSGYSAVGGAGSLSLDESEVAIRWTRTSYETWGAYVLNNSLSNYQFDTFSSYTTTFEWKLGPLHTADTTYNFQIINGPSTYTILSRSLISNSTLQENGWYRFTRIEIPPLDGSGQTIQYRIVTGSKGSLVTDLYWRKLEYKKTIKTNKEQCFNYFAGQVDKMVVNKTYPTIVTDGMVLNLDAGFVPSYPTTGTTWYDVSINGNNGELVNGPTFDSGNLGSLVFDGVDDEVNIPFYTDLQSSTTSLWIKFNNLNSYFLRVTGASPGYYQWYVHNDGRLQFEYSRSSPSVVASAVISSVNSVNIDLWYNLVIVVSSNSGSSTIYRNGINIQSSNWTSSGTIIPTVFNLGKTVNGNISQLQIYNRALSASEIQQNYYQGNLPTTSLSYIVDPANLVSNGTSTTITDLTSNAFVFNYEGTTSISQDFGGSLRLNTGRLYRNVISWYGNYTFGFWFKNQGSIQSALFYTESNRGPSGCARVYSIMQSNGTFRYRVWDNSSTTPLGGAQRQVDTITNVQDGNWHFVTCVWSNGNSNRARGLYVFVNGVLEATTDMIGNDGAYASFHLGGVTGCLGTTAFNCYLGPFMQYSNLAMSNGQVLDLYNTYQMRYR